MKKYLPIIGILFLGLGLRIYYMAGTSLWHDEAFSAFLIQYPWAEMMHRIEADVHPPVYYFLLRFWHDLFGVSIWSLRGFSILFEVGTIWAAWLFVKTAFKENFGQKAALWAALLLAINPFQIQYMGEARMYSMGVFFSLLAAYFLVKALHEQKDYYEKEAMNMPNLPEEIRLKRNYRWHYLWFAVCTSIIILTHYYLLFTASALGAYGLLYVIFHYRGHIKRYIPLLSSFVFIVLSFLPWLPTFLHQYKQVQDVYWIDKMTVWSIPSTLWTILLGLNHDLNNPTTQKVLVVVTLFSVFLLIRFLQKTNVWEKWLVTLCMVAPFAGALLFIVLARLKGSTSSVYLERYFLYASSFYIIILVVWIVNIRTKWLSVTLLTLYTATVAIILGANIKQVKVPPKSGMGAAAKFLSANVEPGQKVFIGLPWEYFNYKYYFQTYYPTPVKPLLFSSGVTLAKDISHFAGNALLTDEELVPNFTAAAKSGDTVWLVWTYAFRSRKPEVPLSWVQVDEKEYPDVLPYVGASVYVTQYRVN